MIINFLDMFVDINECMPFFCSQSLSQKISTFSPISVKQNFRNILLRILINFYFYFLNGVDKCLIKNSRSNYINIKKKYILLSLYIRNYFIEQKIFSEVNKMLICCKQHNKETWQYFVF